MPEEIVSRLRRWKIQIIGQVIRVPAETRTEELDRRLEEEKLLAPDPDPRTVGHLQRQFRPGP